MSNESRKLSTGSLLIDRQQDGIRQRLKSMTGLEEHSGMGMSKHVMDLQYSSVYKN